jgi:hypothetical protein
VSCLRSARNKHGTSLSLELAPIAASLLHDYCRICLYLPTQREEKPKSRKEVVIIAVLAGLVDGLTKVHSKDRKRAWSSLTLGK